MNKERVLQEREKLECIKSKKGMNRFLESVRYAAFWSLNNISKYLKSADVSTILRNFGSEFVQRGKDFIIAASILFFLIMAPILLPISLPVIFLWNFIKLLWLASGPKGKENVDVALKKIDQYLENNQS